MLPFAKFADLAAKSQAESSSLLAASRASVVGGSSSDGVQAGADSFPPVFRPMFPPGGLFPGADTALIYRGLGEFPLAPTGLPAFCKSLYVHISYKYFIKLGKCIGKHMVKVLIVHKNYEGF